MNNTRGHQANHEFRSSRSIFCRFNRGKIFLIKLNFMEEKKREKNITFQNNLFPINCLSLKNNRLAERTNFKQFFPVHLLLNEVVGGHQFFDFKKDKKRYVSFPANITYLCRTTCRSILKDAIPSVEIHMRFSMRCTIV